MNISRKRAKSTPRGTFGILWMLLFMLLLGVHRTEGQNIDHIYTDYLGYWSSGAGTEMSPIKPDYSHNLLGFRINGKTYSTGVKDAILTSYGVDFIPMNYQALPVVNVPITSGSSRFVMFGEMQDGIHDGVKQGSIPFPYSLPVTLYDVMTDGIQGLDISTGVTNMKNKNGTLVEMIFPTIIENIDQIGDGIPDILVTQTASPNSIIDKLWFTEVNGNNVGNTIDINQTKLPDLGKTKNDFFDPNDGTVGGSFINSERGIKISAYDVSEFGITASNYKQAQRLVYKMGGSSDPAFVAFNTELIKILVANNDMAQTNINHPVEIDVLQNDHMPTPENLEVRLDPDNPPSNGTVTLDPVSHQVTYTPNPGFTGVDNFKYKIRDSETSDVAMVTVVVGAADLVVTKIMSDDVPKKGDRLKFTVTVRNDGPYDALVVRVNDLLPEGYAYITHQVSTGSYSPLTGVWFVGTLSANKEADNHSATLTIDVTVEEQGPYTNTAIAETVNYDPNLENNKASVTPGTLPSASLEVDCMGGLEFEQVKIRLTGEFPWKINYSFNGELYTLPGITTDSLELELEGGGSFYLMSVEDRFGNKIDYPISPNFRKHVNPCFVVTNPSLLSRVRKQ